MKIYETKEARLRLAKTIAEEGMVLLKNEKYLLPLQEDTSIAVFGRAQLQTLIGGGGSGASSSEEATIILDELKKVGLKPIEEIEKYYRTQLLRSMEGAPDKKEAMREFEDLISSGMIYEIFGRYTPPTPEFSVPVDLVSIPYDTTTALCVIGRGSGGEECDRRIEEDYYLTESEKQMVEMVATHFDKVVVILNVNGFIDLSWVKEYPSLRAVVYMGTAGEQGAAALADLLVGKASPSGKLSATMALYYEDYPCAQSFFTNKDKPETILTYSDYQLSAEQNGSIGYEKSPVAFYKEGIYVGYRYFDTFNKEILYPFGYGLSYAEFDLEFLSSRLSEEALVLTLQVTNISKEYAGKEVAEIYVSAPEGKLEKPYQELLAYEKSKCLAPGESEQLLVSLPFSEMASYEEATASYIIEEGDYYIRLGNSSRNTKIIGKISVPQTMVTAYYKNRLNIQPVNKEKLAFLKKKESTLYHYSGEEVEKEMAKCLCTLTHNSVPIRTWKEDTSTATVPVIASTLIDVKMGKVSMESFIAQFSSEELAVLVNGYGPGLPFGGMGGTYPETITYGNGEKIASSTHPIGSVGYVSPAIIKYGIPSAYYKDGPAGVQMIAWPTGMSMACTFNKKLLYEFGHACGTEAEKLHVDSWLAPAVNIQRNPIGGRNFEYYSEDPRHTGHCGLAITLGVEENNKVTTCPKHFALNEQETYRRGSSKKSYDALDSIVEERAAREIYLKPFEMIVRGSKVSTLMTSFNKINGTFAAGNKDLCNGILREEWGYQGIVVTDWGDMDIVVDGADAIAAGNDIIMPGGPPVIYQVIKGYEEGRCSIADLRKAVANLLHFVMNSKSFESYMNRTN
jgi:beta-glucosidase